MDTKEQLNPKWFIYGLRPIIIILSIVFAVIVVRSCLQKRGDIEEIKANFEFSTGEIVEYTTAGKGGAYRSIDYKYSVNNHDYEGNISPQHRLTCEVNSLVNCIGKKYTVIYSKKNPEKSYLLCERYGYELFSLPVPEQFE